MDRRDTPAFYAMLDSVLALLTRGAYTPPDADAKAMWVRMLARYSLADVRAAFDAHVKDPVRGRFPPVPADLIAQLDQRQLEDGRPGAEEAWAIALPARDERATVVWTAEIAHAWGVCLPVLEGGDEVGARMAFRETYTRLVGEARAAGEPCAWIVAEGFDAQQRAPAIARAAELGRLPPPEPAGHLAIDGPEETESVASAGRAKVREQMKRLQARMDEKAREAGRDQLERDRTAALQVEQQQRVAKYAAQHGQPLEASELTVKPPTPARRGGNEKAPAP